MITQQSTTQAEATDHNARWYALDADDEELGKVLPSILTKLQNDQQTRLATYIRNLRLYGQNAETLRTSPTLGACMNVSQGSGSLSGSGSGSRLMYNVCKSGVDTLASKIGQNKVRGMFLTDNGNWSMRRRARKLERALEGVKDDFGFNKEARRALYDCLQVGDGAVKITDDGDRGFIIERTHMAELFVDEQDAMYGAPRSLYQYSFSDKDSVAAYLGSDDADLRQRIMDLPTTTAFPNSMTQGVRVYEAWRLPEGTAPEADTQTAAKGNRSEEEIEDETAPRPYDLSCGRHVIIVEDVVVVDEAWEDDHFPFAFLSFSKLPVGFYSIGVIDELTPFQIEINRTLWTCSEAMRLLASPKLIVQANSIVSGQPHDNAIASVIKVTGGKPEVYAPAPINNMVIQWLDWVTGKAFEQIGVSQLQATARKPAGLNSGVAMRTYNDIQSDRFMLFGQAWEEFHVDASRLLWRAARRIAARNPKWEIVSTDKRWGVEKFVFADIDVPDEAARLAVFPVSQLPSTPYAKLEFVQELRSMGIVTMDDMPELLRMPDTESILNLAGSARDVILKNIDLIAEKNRYERLEPTDNLALSLKLAVQTYNMWKVEGAPQKTRQTLLAFIADIKDMMQKATPPAAPQGADPAAQQVPAEPQAAQGLSAA